MLLKQIKLLLGILTFTSFSLSYAAMEARGIEELAKGGFHFDSEILTELSHKQKPKVLVIACSDSRVDPALITGSLPGDIFVLRNIANLIPSYEAEKLSNGATGAAIEYAVNALKVSDIIIMGHSNCGGIKALMARDENAKHPNGEFIDTWLDIDKEVKQSVLKDKDKYTKEELLKKAEIVSVANSEDNLMTYPCVKKAVEEGTLTLHQWYFDIHEKKIVILDKES